MGLLLPLSCHHLEPSLQGCHLLVIQPIKNGVLMLLRGVVLKRPSDAGWQRRSESEQEPGARRR